MPSHQRLVSDLHVRNADGRPFLPRVDSFQSHRCQRQYRQPWRPSVSPVLVRPAMVLSDCLGGFLCRQLVSRALGKIDEVSQAVGFLPDSQAPGDDRLPLPYPYQRRMRNLCLCCLRDADHDDVVVVFGEQSAQFQPASRERAVAPAQHCRQGQDQRDVTARLDHVVGDGSELGAKPGVAVADGASRKPS